jgi:CheY-like chemotaxis protein
MTAKTSSGTSVVHVLVVDDHPSTASTMARAISQLGPGVEVVSAESGEQALGLVKNKTVDLLITDMVMPGMTGLELIEKLQAHPGGRPAYTALMTAYDVPGLKETARRLNVNEVINKPIRPERICQIVSNVIHALGEAPVSQAPSAKPELKILVTGDVSDNVALLSAYLESEGYACLSASGRVEALAKTRAETPDLVLLDVSLSIRDGLQTLLEMRVDAAIGHIPVIILTAARNEPLEMEYALSVGADGYVTKPFDRRELLARIRTRVRAREAEDVIRQWNKTLNPIPEFGRELGARLEIEDLIDVLLHHVVDALGASCGHAVLLTPNGPWQKSCCVSDYAATAPGVPLPPSWLTQIRDTRQGFIVDDTLKDPSWQALAGDSTRAVVVAPMSGRHDNLGLLVLAHERPGYFSLEHKRLLEAIASEAAMAVENVQLYAGSVLRYQRMLAVMPNAEDAILTFDAGSRLLTLNPGAEALLGWGGAEVGQPLAQGHGYDALIRLLEKAGSAQQPASGEVAWPDHRAFTVFVIPAEGGGCLVVLRDISHLRALDQAKSDFIAATTHDLSHLLTLMTLTSQSSPKPVRSPK